MLLVCKECHEKLSNIHIFCVEIEYGICDECGLTINEEVTMVKKCMECGKKTGTGQPNELVSHGYCKKCEPIVMARVQKELDEIEATKRCYCLICGDEYQWTKYDSGFCMACESQMAFG